MAGDALFRVSELRLLESKVAQVVGRRRIAEATYVEYRSIAVPGHALVERLEEHSSRDLQAVQAVDRNFSFILGGQESYNRLALAQCSEIGRGESGLFTKSLVEQGG